MTRRITAHYFASTSSAPLDAVCGRIQSAFNTEPFEFDSHRHWEYAKASAGSLAFNITRCSDTETIEKWIEGTPPGVNYQAIIWCPDSERAETLARFGTELEAVLGSPAEHFLSSTRTPSAHLPEEPDSSDGEPASGFSLPLTWFLAIVLVAAVALGIRACSA